LCRFESGLRHHFKIQRDLRCPKAHFWPQIVGFSFPLRLE
jgi:hypothetical protein